jgi:hypothetical protein
MEERQEQRISSRFDSCWSLQAQREATEVIAGNTLNISLTGLMFATPFKYDLLEEVQLEIWPGYFSPISCTVTIVREEASPDGSYCYGARFSSISEANLELLDEALWAARCRAIVRKSGLATRKRKEKSRFEKLLEASVEEDPGSPTEDECTRG